MLSLLAGLLFTAGDRFALPEPRVAASWRPSLEVEQDDLDKAFEESNAGRFKEALVIFDRVRPEAKEKGDTERFLRASFGLAWTLERLFQYARELQVCEEALQVAGARRDRVVMRLRSQRLFALLYLDRLQDHRQELDKFLDECLKGDDQALTFDVYRLIYSLCIQGNDQLGALEIARKEVEIAKKGLPKTTLAGALENLSSSLGQMGLYDESIAAGLDALALLGPRTKSESLDDRLTRLNSLEWVATAYAWLGQLDPAEAYFKEMLDLAKGMLNVNGIGSSIVGLGLVYTFEKRFEDTIKLVNEGLALSRLGSYKIGIVLCDLVLGYTVWQQGDYDRCLKYADDALAAAKGTGEMVPYYSSLSQCIRSLALSRLGRTKEAIEAGTIARSTGIRLVFDPIRKAMYAVILGIAYEADGDMDQAENLYREMVDLIEGTSTQIQDPSQLGALQQRIPNPYGYFAFAKFKNLGAMDALLARERGRARGLARQIALTGDGDYSRYFAGDEAKQLKDLLLKASAASARLRAVQAKSPADPGELAKATEALNAIEADIENLKVKIYARNPRLKELHAQAEAPPTRAVLERLSRDHPDTAYLEWALIDRRHTLLMVLCQGKTTCLDLPVGEYAIDEIVSKWHDAIARSGGRAGNSGAEPAPSGQESEPDLAAKAYAMLVGPAQNILDQAKVERLVFVPDGSLADMPFAALLDAKGKRLVQSYAVSQTVSLGVLTWKPNPFEYDKEFFCVADTTSDDGLVAKAARSRAGLGALPYARAEGMAVARLFPGVKPLMGPEATEERVRAEMGRYRILHFACHGSLEARDSLRNGLVLAAEPEGSAYDGILQSREIVGMKLSAQLTVLSACDTGRGAAKGGDGLQSLAWAFRGANCPAVIASHWQVDDEATGQMMTTLYNALAKGTPKDKALQMAALQVMKSHKSPYYWAAFDLIGDASPIKKN